MPRGTSGSSRRLMSGYSGRTASCAGRRQPTDQQHQQHGEQERGREVDDLQGREPLSRSAGQPAVGQALTSRSQAGLPEPGPVRPC